MKTYRIEAIFNVDDPLTTLLATGERPLLGDQNIALEVSESGAQEDRLRWGRITRIEELLTAEEAMAEIERWLSRPHNDPSLHIRTIVAKYREGHPDEIKP